jgi:hypothetical protein
MKRDIGKHFNRTKALKNKEKRLACGNRFLVGMIE